MQKNNINPTSSPVGFSEQNAVIRGPEKAPALASRSLSTLQGLVASSMPIQEHKKSVDVRRGSFIKTQSNLAKLQASPARESVGAGGASVGFSFDIFGEDDGGHAGSGAAARNTSFKKPTVGMDYRKLYESKFHLMMKEVKEIGNEHISAKVRLMEAMPLRGRASESILNHDHLRRVPHRALQAQNALHLSVVTTMPYDWPIGVPISPTVRVALLDQDEIPVPAWSASIEIKAFLINGVGDIIREGYDDRTSILGNVSYLVGSHAEMPDLRVMIPSCHAKKGFFQIVFVASDYNITPAISDRFAIHEERASHFPNFMIEDDTAVEVLFSSPSNEKDKKKKVVVPEASPLHVCVARGQVELCRLLLDKGDRGDAVGQGGVTPLHVAAYMGLTEIVELLLSRGTDVNKPSEDGFTALHFAVVGGISDMTKLLIARSEVQLDAEINANFEAIHLAARVGATDIIRALHAKDPTCVNRPSRRDHQTPLHIALFHGFEDTAQVLIDLGASITARARQGWTAAHLAALGGNVGAVETLIAAGAPLDPLIDSTNFTPIHIACLRGLEDVVTTLLEGGANPTLVAKGNWSAAHLAAVSGDKDTYDTILPVCGIDPDHASADLASPANLAELFITHIDHQRILMDSNEASAIRSIPQTLHAPLPTMRAPLTIAQPATPTTSLVNITPSSSKLSVG